ncbi:Elongation factor Tu GTP binding domain containing protein [Brugia malayi]|uniref:Bm13815 n=1 Tax=Brugia malayi TaxID=6279 RepID=A0A0H5SAW5_BRUMA|nr:Elongation factor Tu GTP binding domain containing protein [Brugia malayi]CRZ25260.1 Bm13815 [Brugia malayi]VIO99051.1 Elongation factor Tu GTP binding domain containing protein [Brugia malayi]
MQQLMHLCAIRWLLDGSVRFVRLSPKCYVKRKRRKFIDPIVVGKTPSKKKVAEIYEDMKVGELAKVLGSSDEEIFQVLKNINNSPRINNEKLDMSTITTVVGAFGLKPKLIPHPRSIVSEHFELDAFPQPPPPENELRRRAPIITIMGHVDHGKTTLLDCLRHSQIVESEYGGITQHIGAFTLKEKDCEITFLDTPGHAAFAKMRERGAHSTDIVVLVVAADDGVNEQTVQSINYAKTANVPIVVAINKIDKANANPIKAKQSLVEHGILVDDLGGDVLCVEISALKGENVDELKEAILLQAEDMNLRSTWSGLVEGIVIESKIQSGIGKVCTMIVQRGTLVKGAALVAGTCWARVRSMHDEFGHDLVKAIPSTPVVVSGWRENLPTPGERVLQLENESRAQEVVRYRLKKEMNKKAEEDWKTAEQRNEKERKEYLENRRKLLDAGLRAGSTLRLIVHKEQKYQKDVGNQKPYVRLMLNTDVDGTLEAILNVFDTYKSEEVELDLVKFDVGPPSESDVKLAKDLGILLYCFNVQVPLGVKRTAEQLGVEISCFNVIYRLVEDLKSRLSNCLPEEVTMEQVGEGHVIKSFSVIVERKKQSIGGILVDWGTINKSDLLRVLRDTTVIFEGSIRSMRVGTQVVSSASKNEEVGVAVSNDKIVFKEDDIVETYREKKVKRQISWDPPGF